MGLAARWEEAVEGAGPARPRRRPNRPISSAERVATPAATRAEARVAWAASERSQAAARTTAERLSFRPTRTNGRYFQAVSWETVKALLATTRKGRARRKEGAETAPCLTHAMRD